MSCPCFGGAEEEFEPSNIAAGGAIPGQESMADTRDAGDMGGCSLLVLAQILLT